MRSLVKMTKLDWVIIQKVIMHRSQNCYKAKKSSHDDRAWSREVPKPHELRNWQGSLDPRRHPSWLLFQWVSANNWHSRPLHVSRRISWSEHPHLNLQQCCVNPKHDSKQAHPSRVLDKPNRTKVKNLYIASSNKLASIWCLLIFCVSERSSRQ